MELKKLPKEVSSLLRTGVTITSPSQCVAELVTNALDAGATSVAVRIDFRTFKLQVIDNGFGITKKNLDLIGKRYMTSKCHSLTELEGQLDKFGFRGEAIASLREASGLLNVTSRAQGSSSTYSKVFAHGKSTSVGLTADQRPSHGSTITVQDFLYNMPVRRKRIKESVDFEEMKTQLESLALVHPQVSFSLRNDASGKLMLQTRKCQNTVEAFRNLFGLKVASCLRPVEFSEGNIEISGFIGKEVYHQKTLQFLYINNRLVVKTKLHKLIHMVLAKSFLLKAPGPWLNLPIPKDMNERFGMPMPKKSKHPMFVINLKCPYTEYDITLDPRKTLVQFKNADRVLNCLEEAVKLFLQRENLTVVSPETSGDKPAPEPSLLDEMEQLDKEDVLSEGELEEKTSHNKRKHRPTPQLHIARAVHGLPAKRHKTTVREEQKKPSTPPEPEVQQDSDCVEMVTQSSDNFSSPSPKVSHTVKKTKHHKPNLIFSSDSAGDSDTPVDTWTKYKARTAAKKNAKEQKKPKFSDNEQVQVLPTSLSKLKIYSLAASTLKKTFAHHNENEQTEVVKPDTMFPVYHDEPLLEDSFITPQKSGDTAAGQDIPDFPPTVPHAKRNVIEAPQPIQNQILTHQNKYKENTSASHFQNESLPCDSSHNQVFEVVHSHEQNQQSQYYCDLQNVPLVPEKNQYTEVSLSHNNPPYSVRESGKYLNTTDLVSDKYYRKSSYDVCCDDNVRMQRPEDYGAHNRNSCQSYGENTWSSGTKKNQEVEYSESHYDEDNNLQKERKYESRKHKESFLSPLSSSLEHVESPQTFNSFNDDVLSSDSMSEEHYERLEARLREPLEQISREINKTRHSMLHSTSPILIKSPEFQSPELDEPQPNPNPNQVNSKYNQPSTSDLKFSRLGSFLYDKRSKSHYRPSSHINKIQSTSSICDIQQQDESRAPVDTPFTKLSKHITEIENLTERKLSVDDSFNIPVDTPSVGQIIERQRLAGLDHVCITERVPCSSHNIQQFHLKYMDQTSRLQNAPILTENYDDPLSTSAVLNQLGPRTEAVSPLQDENFLSAAAVLQQLNTTETTAQDCQIIDEDMPATAEEVLLQLGAPVINKKPPIPRVMSSEDLLLSGAMLKQLAPSRVETIPEHTSEDIFSSTPVLQKLAPPTFTAFFDSRMNTTNESCFPVTPEVDKNCVELTEASMMPQETPVMSENHCLVPYSGSSASDDMECNGSKPTWRSIVDAPDDTVSGSNDNFFALLSAKKHLPAETPFLPIECFDNTPHISESLKPMLLERTQLNFKDYINNSQEICTDKEFHSNQTTTDVPVLTESDKTNQCDNMEVGNEDTVLTSTIDKCDNSGDVIMFNTSPKLQDANVWEEREDPNGRKYYVNRKSGITSYEAPVLEQFGFSMTPRHAFMPKGSSPVLKLACDKQLNAVPLNEQEQQQLQADVTNCLEDDLNTVKWTKQQAKPSGFEQLVQKLLSESESRVHEKTISNACEHGGALVKVHNSLNQYKFSKDMLTSFKVLGQWDDKFVLTAVSMQSDQQPHLLVLFDQHAVHERVRLERLTRGYQSVRGEEGQFHAEEINPPLLLELSEREVRVMSSFTEQFTRLGLEFSLVSDTCVRVTHVSTSFKLRDERQRGSRGRSLEELVTSLVREQAHSVLQTRGIGARVPPTLQSVLNSEACTGAIKFGDPLSDKECTMLLACLSSCEVPFQCAHGRPVLAPIADFKHLQQARVKVQKPRLGGLLEKLSAAME